LGLFRRSFVQTSLDTDIFQKPSLSRFWPFGELVQPAFVVWLYGRTGTLKSSLAALVLNHFGPDFDGFHFPASLLDTPGRPWTPAPPRNTGGPPTTWCARSTTGPDAAG
jgi:hypothetical protein